MRTTWQPFQRSLVILAPTPLVWSENEHAITLWQYPKKDLPEYPSQDQSTYVRVQEHNVSASIASHQADL